MFNISHYPNINIYINFIPKSPVSDDYNCIAWSLGIDYMSVGHENLRGIYQPPNISKIPNINNDKRMYNYYGFIDADDSSIEIGYEKIVIYIKDGIVTHAAKQYNKDWWHSKMGASVDAIHHLNAIQGAIYGYPEFYMKRKNS